MKIRQLVLFAFTLLFFSKSGVNAQVVHFDHGKVEFYTTTILSDIDAISEHLIMHLDMENGEFKVVIDITSFEFEYELMQEHFNENYMESDKFPKAVFKGKVLQDISGLETEKEVDVAGTIEIHGIEKDLNMKAVISKKEDLVHVKCKFPILFKDFNVDEPSILTKKVAKDVEVKCNLYLK